MDSPASPSRNQAVLFRTPHGSRVRWMARSAMVLGSIAAAAAGLIVLRSGYDHGFTGLSLGPLTVATVVAASGLCFAVLCCRFTRQFVTHLEIWPRSNLAIVRTSGCWHEMITLVAWSEFRTGDLQRNRVIRDPLLRIQLRSGRRLAFDQHHGEAPAGWIALHRFLEKCSVPEAGDAESTTSGLDLTTPHAELRPS